MIETAFYQTPSLTFLRNSNIQQGLVFEIINIISFFFLKEKENWAKSVAGDGEAEGHE